MSLRLRHADIFQEGVPYFLADTLFSDERLSQFHQHDFYEIFMIREGLISHEMNGEKQEVGRGMLCFLRPEDRHAFRRLGKGVARMTNLAFTAELYDEVMTFLFGTTWPARVEMPGRAVPVDEHLGMSMESLFRIVGMEEGTGSFQWQPGRVKHLLGSVFLGLARVRIEQEEQVPGWLSRTLVLMEEPENFEEGIPQFIRLSGKSQEHLTRSMQRYLGTTPTRFINRLRIQKSMHLLRSTSMGITAIVYESGFQNISHFNRIFKQHNACTPGAFRQRAQQVIKPILT